ncbi:delta-12 fatty acid desaturase [Dendrothele bispora CBS 962.96]|uniref:Delta-12 fatty acid desaturase n=1 Tax=Dendrothele bispora (strain CBS 962.96) TaxID=1314807 RepID=A0A4S8LW30_DENBC|nr:delta-12 fatty acid desaturase [Dendrothele bispora CBS 962.96]
MLSSYFRDSPEYERRKATPFAPPLVTWSELHAMIPRHLFVKNTLKGLSYVVRDVILAYLLYKLAWQISPIVSNLQLNYRMSSLATSVVNMCLWLCYWHCQGILLTSWWCLAHEASHGTLSPHRWVNDFVGFLLHTTLLVPYFAWKSSHHSHHISTVSVERDENYVPPTRSQTSLPPSNIARIADYREALEESPLHTFLRIIAMQLLGLHSYLFFNCKGSPRYPPGTNHFDPNSALFKSHERTGVLISDVGLAIMCFMLYIWAKHVGLVVFVRFYLIPFMLVNHWIVLLTYLQHTDPTIPYYREKEWSFVRGALSTVDRPLLGWIGRVFFHNVSHNHISHHLFSSIPFYNQPEATECIKAVLKDAYNYDSTNTLRALYRSFVECEFIEDDGEIIFYKNRQGKATRVLAPKAQSNEATIE